MTTLKAISVIFIVPNTSAHHHCPLTTASLASAAIEICRYYNYNQYNYNGNFHNVLLVIYAFYAVTWISIECGYQAFPPVMMPPERCSIFFSKNLLFSQEKIEFVPHDVIDVDKIVVHK